MPPYRFVGQRPLRIKYGYELERVLEKGDTIDELDHPRLQSCVDTGDLIDIAPPEPEPNSEPPPPPPDSEFAVEVPPDVPEEPADDKKSKKKGRKR